MPGILTLMKGDKTVDSIKHLSNFRLLLHRWEHYLGLQDVVIVKPLNSAAFNSSPFYYRVEVTQEWIDDAFIVL